MDSPDTIVLMQSDDYKERFRAEYHQVRIRYEKLKTTIEKLDNGTLEFPLPCPHSLYKMQLKAMEDYMQILETRAGYEGITL